jgi:hypothetical protein
MFFVPSFAIHRGRVIVGLYPQTVRGYLLRATGKVPAWKPTPLVGEALTAAQKAKAKVVGVIVTDPRPTLRQLCSLGPLLGSLADSSSPGSFDVGRIPHAQVITEPLYPNVTLLTDDGQMLRLDTRASLAVPFFDLSGTDAYFTAIIGYQLLRLGTK